MVLLLAGDLLNGVTTFAGGFVGFDASTMRSVIGQVHRSAAARLHAGHMFMLKGLDESPMTLSFLR